MINHSIRYLIWILTYNYSFFTIVNTSFLNLWLIFSKLKHKTQNHKHKMQNSTNLNLKYCIQNYFISFQNILLQQNQNRSFYQPTAHWCAQHKTLLWTGSMKGFFFVFSVLNCRHLWKIVSVMFTYSNICKPFFPKYTIKYTLVFCM